jgi:hypothetical protein
MRWPWQKKRKHELVVNDHRLTVPGTDSFLRCYECVICRQYWIWAEGAELVACPGVRVYTNKPSHLLTERHLRMIGYKPIASRVGCTEDGENLYDIRNTVALPTVTQTQREAMSRLVEEYIRKQEQALIDAPQDAQER